MAVTAIVLAAGEGTRMKSKRPKVVHEVLGRPMVLWVVQAAREAGAERVVVVVGNGAEQVEALLAGEPDVECVLQAERLGTGHAVKVALEQAGVTAGPTLVLCGDTPLLRGETLARLVEAAGTSAGGALLTMTYEDPTGYGRVTLDDEGRALRIVEQKDCTPEEAACTTCNAGVYCFDASLLSAHIGELSSENAQGEYYLTDMVAILRSHGAPMAAISCDEDPDELMGVNSRIQLAQATKVMQRRINARLMAAGVTMLDPDQVWVGPDVEVGRDTVLLPGTMLMGATKVGEDCTLGPLTRLTKSTVGPGSKVPHLSYIGDCTIGSGVNIGAGTITCNYDGKCKHATTVGDGSFVGSDTMLVAPVNVGAGCTIGAGSVITRDVPDGALAVERSDQRMVEGWLPRWKRGEARG